jgi:hypothetical protein
MINWLKEHKKGLIRGMFLIPILLVMIISISHVVSWYDIANPFSWAIYLSVAIEVAAMSSIAAASVKVKGGVWVVFIIVTLIQFIGNIFFCYNEVNVNTQEFKSWVELTNPVFEILGSDVNDVIAQKRWLALLEGGLLPIISLASLHFFIKYGGVDDEKKVEWKGTVTYKQEKKEPEVVETIEPEVVETIEPEVVEEVIEPNEVVEKNDEKRKKNLSDILAINMMKKNQNMDKWA